MIKLRSSLLALASVLVLNVSVVCAQEDDKWWFDVEVIVFDRNQLLGEIAEKFEFEKSLIRPSADLDLLTQNRTPNVSWLYQGLNSCDTEEVQYLPSLQLEDLTAQTRSQSEQKVDELSVSLLSTEVDTESDINSFDSSLNNELANDLEITLPSQLISNAEHWLYFFAESFLKTDSNTGASSIITFPKIGCVDKSISYDAQAYPQPDRLAVNHFGIDHDPSWGPGLLSKEQLELQELSLRIRSERGLTRLLHVAWRQPVEFGPNNAQTVRIYGGQNYAPTFDLNGDPISSLVTKEEFKEISDYDPASIFEFERYQTKPDNILLKDFKHNLGIALQQKNVVEDELSKEDDNPIWQVDGTIKVYLQNVNRVPYLHIDGDIAYRQPFLLESSEDNIEQLVSIPYKQLRRVISTQLHYFDHPMFGVLIEIRRYKKP